LSSYHGCHASVENVSPSIAMTCLMGSPNFSANASHQLRSPLTAIAISLELIADSPDPLARREAAERAGGVFSALFKTVS
jgi:hypothetical protein